MLPHIRPARWLLALGLAGLLLLFAFNIRNQFDHPNDWSAVRSDLRQALTILVIIGACWIITDNQRAKAATRQHETATAIAAALDSYRSNADTAPIPVPIPRIRIVGTAAVAVAPVPAAIEGELPDYDKGYADGLARLPMRRDAQVIPINSGRN